MKATIEEIIVELRNLIVVYNNKKEECRRDLNAEDYYFYLGSMRTCEKILDMLVGSDVWFDSIKEWRGGGDA